MRGSKGKIAGAELAAGVELARMICQSVDSTVVTQLEFATSKSQSP